MLSCKHLDFIEKKKKNAELITFGKLPKTVFYRIYLAYSNDPNALNTFEKNVLLNIF